MTGRTSDDRSHRPRGPGYLFTAAVTCLALVLGVVALDASQAPPPTVAEFAPSALEQIKDAPDRQSSDVGEGKPGSRGSASPSPSPTASVAPPPVIDVPRVRKCVGNPPRQIEDPQSPPCVPYWKGNNGGATTFGVTRDEIRVAIPFGTAFTGDPTAQYEAMANFFNARFEFYGRKIRLLTFGARGDNFAHPNPPDMIADATYAASELKAFAALGYPDRKGAEQTYYDELARRRVVSVIGRDTAKGTEAYLASKHPYQWTRGTTVDVQLRNYGQFVCGSLAGKAPQYGGPAWPWAPQPTARKFGVLVNIAKDGTKPSIAPLQSALGACGVRPDVVEAYVVENTGQDAVNPVLNLTDRRITSVICVCEVGSAREYMNAAEGQGYRPEWLMGTYINNDLENSFSTSPPGQSRNVIGITFTDKILRAADQWWYAAMRQGDPSVAPPASNFPIAMYQDLLLLASGIQMAGPNLTPETFADGLNRTVFPNPGAGAAPYYQSRVGFPGQTHSMRLNASMYWYDQSRRGLGDPTTPGRICYVYRGRRFDLDRWPKGDPPFRADCL